MVRRNHNQHADSPPAPLVLIAIALILALAYSAGPVFSAFHQNVERANVDSMLDRLHLAVTAYSEQCLAEDKLPKACNPFTLLNPPPANYLGVEPQSNLHALPAGCWCFVSEFNWIAYRPLHQIYNGVRYGDSNLVIYVVSPVQGQPGRTGIRLVQPPRFSYAWK